MDEWVASVNGDTEPKNTIVELTAATPSLSTLVTAVTAAALGGTLSSTGPFTVFAPNNAAFAAVPTKVLAALLLPANNAKLVELLKYHVVSGSVKSGALEDGMRVQTLLEGAEVKVGVDASGVTVNGAKVLSADVVASNGVVHVINSVLIPTSMDEWVASVNSDTEPLDGASVFVEIEVSGVTESVLVADRNMQKGMINGLAVVTGVTASMISMTKIGNTKLNMRRLSSVKLSITFDITVDSEETASMVQSNIRSVSARAITTAIEDAGVDGIRVVSSPEVSTTYESSSSSSLNDRELTVLFVGVTVSILFIIAAATTCISKMSDSSQKPVAYGSTEYALR